MDSNVVPGQAGLLPGDSINPEFANFCEICNSHVVILYSRVEILIVVVDEMLTVIEPCKS
jgi:hypothetical protein